MGLKKVSTKKSPIKPPLPYPPHTTHLAVLQQPPPSITPLSHNTTILTTQQQTNTPIPHSYFLSQSKKMQTLHRYYLIPFFILFISCSAAAAPQDLLRSSCIHARYPSLCVQTLSTYTTPSTTPLNLAQAAVRVTLAHARALSAYLNTLQSQLQAAPSLGSNKRQRVAVSDCAVQISDSVDELTRTLNELQYLRATGTASFQWHMSNAQTWTSAALTDGDSCINGFRDGDDGSDGKVRLDVKRRVKAVAMLTSNALYLITRVGGGNNSIVGKHRSDSKN